MSHGNGSSTFVFQVMGILKPVTISTDQGLKLSHSPMVGCHSLYGSNFDSKCGRGGGLPSHKAEGARECAGKVLNFDTFQSANQKPGLSHVTGRRAA